MAESIVIEYVGGKRDSDGNLSRPEDLRPLRDSADSGLHVLMIRELAESDDVKLDGDISVRVRSEAHPHDVAALLYKVFRHWYNSRSHGREEGGSTRGGSAFRDYTVGWDTEMKQAATFGRPC